MTHRKPFLVLLLSILAVPFLANAQTPDIHPDTLFSQLLNEKRPLRIIYPKNYDPAAPVKCDVVYVLDGEWNTNLTSTVYGFLEYARFIPTNILIVGIPNTQMGDMNLRHRDFTPANDGSKHSGGAAQFLAFMKSELIPYINSKYAVNPEGSTLYGTSLGGLFVIYAFLHEPSLFKSYLTVEAALWWDNYHLNRIAADKLKSYPRLDNTLWIAARDGGAYRGMGIAGIDSVLRISAPEGLRWKTAPYPDETHFSTIWKGIYEGLRFGYSGRLIEGEILAHPMSGILKKGKPFTMFCHNLSSDSRIAYTTDGTDPTEKSARLQGLTTVTPADGFVLTARSLAARPGDIRFLKPEFKIGEVLPAISKPKGLKQGGVHYAYYEGNWKTLPNLKKLNPQRQGFAGKEVDLPAMASKGNHAFVLEGFLEITEPGYYMFMMSGHNNTKVLVGSQEVITSKKMVGGGESFILPLEKGFYPVHLEYIHGTDGRGVRGVMWRPEGGRDSLVPAESLWGRE